MLRDAMLKRAFDVCVSIVGLVLLFPLGLCVAFLIKVDSPGPVLFRQRRVGLNGVDFTLLKFRSMRTGGAGLLVTVSTDSRITKVGRVLRVTKIDELPQLWNVLVGSMSIVGPRPEVREYVDMFPEGFAIIHTVRPGLTDWASIKFRHEELILASSSDPYRTYVREILPEKIGLACEYVRIRSFCGDCAIIVKTLRCLCSIG